jgi:hypothetical protein
MPCAEGEGTGWASARWLRFALLIAAALSAAAPAGVLAGDAVGAQEMPATAFPAADLQPPALPAGAAVPIALPLFSAQESARLADAQSESGPFRVGFGRSIPQPAAADAAPRWRALPDGRHAAVWRISSPGAVGLRLQLRVLKLPDSATLRFFGPGSERCQTITGASINASLRQDTAAGASGAAAQHYWSPLIQGDTLMLEIELPAGVDPRTVQIALPRARSRVGRSCGRSSRSAHGFCGLANGRKRPLTVPKRSGSRRSRGDQNALFPAGRKDSLHSSNQNDLGTLPETTRRRCRRLSAEPQTRSLPRNSDRRSRVVTTPTRLRRRDRQLARTRPRRWFSGVQQRFRNPDVADARPQIRGPGSR